MRGLTDDPHHFSRSYLATDAAVKQLHRCLREHYSLGVQARNLGPLDKRVNPPCALILRKGLHPRNLSALVDERIIDSSALTRAEGSSWVCIGAGRNPFLEQDPGPSPERAHIAAHLPAPCPRHVDHGRLDQPGQPPRSQLNRHRTTRSASRCCCVAVAERCDAADRGGHAGVIAIDSPTDLQLMYPARWPMWFLSCCHSQVGIECSPRFCSYHSDALQASAWRAYSKQSAKQFRAMPFKYGTCFHAWRVMKLSMCAKLCATRFSGMPLCKASNCHTKGSAV